MKNVLSYYYQLHLNDIHQNDGIYRFDLNGIHYAFLPYYREQSELNSLYKLSVELLNNGVYCHQFIPNKDYELITMVNQKPYVLFQVYHIEKTDISVNDIQKFALLSSGISFDDQLKRNNWSTLWENKIDYFEYQVSQFGRQYPIIRESFSYFLGLVENGISLFNSLNLEDIHLSVAHKRLTKKTFDFYNPLNLIIDYQVRDACEYFKDLFIYKEDIYNDIILYLSSRNLTIYEILLFYTRLFYPSFYFDEYEDIINQEKSDQSLKKIIEKIPYYEKLLKRLYYFLSSYFMMPDIEWIKKT